MSELAKTGIFAGVAVVVSLIALLSRPAPPSAPPASADVGQPVFPSFKDPLTAASLEVLERKNSKTETFKVAQSGGRWVIASYKNYPADAAERLKDAASLLLGAKVIAAQERDRNPDGSEVGEADFFEAYGVVAPTPTTSKDAKGVGTLITVRDAKGGKLASLIVGNKAVAEGEAGDSKLRFVRREDESSVLVADFDLAKLSTNYTDWMQKDLLTQKSPTGGGDTSLTAKLDRATLRDFSLAGDNFESPPQLLAEMKLLWKQADFKWEVQEIRELKGGTLASFTMLESEEPNSERLDDFKRALDELKFAEVEPKPAGIGPDLKAAEALLANDAALAALGERGFKVREGQVYGSGGELVVLAKDGVEYVLRFGGAAKLPPVGMEPAKAGRYLFLAARANTSIIPLPTLDPLPDAGPAAPEVAPPAGEKKEGEAGKKEDAEKKPAAADVAKKKAERERIEKENKRRQDEYEQQVKDADKTVRELNFRFADWYYLVADETYQKIHLTRPDIVREKKDAKETGFDIEAFRDLEGGPKKKEPAPPPGPPGGGFPGGGFPGAFPGHP